MTQQAKALSQSTRALCARRRVFLYDLGWLLLLAAVAVLFFHLGWQDFFVGPLSGPALYAVWFGALGGVAISMKGVYGHTVDWQPRWDLWHYGRPLSGAVSGGMSFVLLRVVVAGSAPPNVLVTDAAAFVLGTQERRFFAFVSEVGKLVLTTPADIQQDRRPTLAAVLLSGSPDHAGAVLRGSGFRPGAVVRWGDAILEGVAVSADGTLATVAALEGAGRVAVWVLNPDGSSAMLAGGFTYPALPAAAAPG